MLSAVQRYLSSTAALLPFLWPPLMYVLVIPRHFSEFLRSHHFCKYQIEVLTSGTVFLADILFCESALFYFSEVRGAAFAWEAGGSPVLLYFVPPPPPIWTWEHHCMEVAFPSHACFCETSWCRRDEHLMVPEP